MAVIEKQREDPVPVSRRGSRVPEGRWRIWRSPAGQPAWARPSLLAIAVLAGLSYVWGADSAVLEPFYGAAARSMSTSWHDFLFGAFDPLGTVTVDKLPGALWPQALLLRVAGFHVWAVVLPQALEGVVTILVLYRAVRRLAGPVAGIAAAAVLAVTPVTVALSRGNVSDSLLIMLTVLAADAASAALLTGRLRSLLLAGGWVGLAFQAKMMQAWLVLPALAVAYLLAAPASRRTRLCHVALAGAVTLVVSLSWMSAVSLVPAHERPFVDGTRNDSLFSQVFDYNGIARLGHGNVFAGSGQTEPFVVDLSHAGLAIDSLASGVGPSWHRLLTGLFGRDVGWFLPAALIAAICVLLARRRARREDPLRACVVMWTVWLAVLLAFFSEGAYLNSYYVAALSPAIAALCGAGIGLAWSRRHDPRVRAVLAGASVATAGYDAYLLGGGTGVPGWLVPVAGCLCIAGSVALVLPGREGVGRHRARMMSVAVAGALLMPAVTSVLVVARGLGPFDAPYQRLPAAASRASFAAALENADEVVERLSSGYGTPIVFAADTSVMASRYILATGEEVLPIGGLLGGIPQPSLAALKRYIRSGQLDGVVIPVAPASPDPRVVWVHSHCQQASPPSGPLPRVQLALYDCAGAVS